MHAITLKDFGGVDQLEWSEVETPTPGPGEVRIKTVAVGLNRADLLQRRGYYPPPPGASELLGLECSGVIDAVGDGVDGWHEGDEAVALLAGGGYAEYVVVPAGQVIAPPSGIDLVSAAGIIEVAATVVSNMDHVGLREGETFLVHGGAGGIGSFAIQYAKAKDCRVLATASSGKLDVVRELGADVAIDYSTNWVSTVKQESNGGVDVILDIIGAKYLDSNLSALAMDGRLVIIGMQKGTKGELNIGKLLNKRATITATSLRGRPVEQKARIARRVHDEVWPLLEDGTIALSRETRVPLREAARAHDLLDSGESVGKIILTLNQDA